VLDLFLHLDEHLRELVTDYGGWIYGILFVIVFCETGLVVTPFLPGDSLLFAAGALAAVGSMNFWLLFALLFVAAVLGDAVNYQVGKWIGKRAFQFESSWWLNPQHLKRTEAFFAKYGVQTIVLARFVPIVRTFAPFVAGIGDMPRPIFTFYNVLGGLFWVLSMLGAGYLFGNIPWVSKNFSAVVLGIVFVSILPMVVEFIRHKSRR
jgi:membrane-associated protein